MAVSDINRQIKTPAGGSDAGNQSIVDFNLKVDGALYIPTGTANTFNGGKIRNGALRQTNGFIYHFYNDEWLPVGADLTNYYTKDESNIIFIRNIDLYDVNQDANINISGSAIIGGYIVPSGIVVSNTPNVPGVGAYSVSYQSDIVDTRWYPNDDVGIGHVLRYLKDGTGRLVYGSWDGSTQIQGGSFELNSDFKIIKSLSLDDSPEQILTRTASGEIKYVIPSSIGGDIPIGTDRQVLGYSEGVATPVTLGWKQLSDLPTPPTFSNGVLTGTAFNPDGSALFAFLELALGTPKSDTIPTYSANGVLHVNSGVASGDAVNVGQLGDYLLKSGGIMTGDLILGGTPATSLSAISKGYSEANFNPLLISGTNIKTINGINILGSGNIDVSGGGGGATTWGNIGGNLIDQTDLITALSGKQNSLIGTGFVKSTEGTISYDNNTYLTTASAASSYEPIITKNTAFNKNFGTTSNTVTEGNDSRVNNGQTAFGWGNHALAGYYSSANTPPYPVRSVNGRTGDVTSLANLNTDNTYLNSNQEYYKETSDGSFINIINPVGLNNDNHLFMGSMGSNAYGIGVWQNKSIIESGKSLVIGSYGDIIITNGGTRTPIANIDNLGNYLGGTTAGSYLARKDKGKKVYLIGDSFIGLDVYITTLEQKLGIVFSTIDGLGGSCIASGKENAEGDGTTRPSYVSRINLAVSSDADIILIETGGNDFHYNVPLGEFGSTDVNTFYGALNVMLGAAATSGKTVKITTPILRTDAQKPFALGGLQNWGYIKQYADAISRVAATLGITVIDQFYGSGINFNNISVTTIDGIHPSTPKGKELYGNYMVDNWNEKPNNNTIIPNFTWQDVTNSGGNKTNNLIQITGENTVGLQKGLTMFYSSSLDASLIGSYDYPNSVPKNLYLNFSGGNVAINKTSASAILDVGGTANFDGAIKNLVLAGIGDRPVLAGSDGTLKVSSNDYAVRNASNVFTQSNLFQGISQFQALSRFDEVEFTKGGTFTTGTADYYTNNSSTVYTKSNRLTFNNGENNQPVSLSNILLSVPRTYSLPDKNGTFAMLSDIPSTSTQTLQQVLTAGNTATVEPIIQKSGSNITLGLSGGGGANGFTVRGNSRDWYHFVQINGNYTFGANQGDKYFFTNDGKFGVNQSSPSQAIDVIGQVKSTAVGIGNAFNAVSTSGVGFLAQSTSGISISGNSDTGKAARFTTNGGTGVAVDIVNNGTGALLSGINGSGLQLTIHNNGDVEFTTIGVGIIAKSPNGTRWRLTPSDAGTSIWTSL